MFSNKKIVASNKKIVPSNKKIVPSNKKIVPSKTPKTTHSSVLIRTQNIEIK
jgi:hypothetical protein